MSRIAQGLALLPLGLAACTAPPLVFADPVGHPDAAFLSVGGTGPDDVWAVGAQTAPQGPPVVLHRQDGGDWDALDVDVMHDLWWVQAFEGGPTYLAGGGATVLRVDGDTIERTPTPVFFGNTVYGIWGAAPDDLWAVGGFAGRDGFVWHWDGAGWDVADLPDDLPRTAAGEVPALFKVWGRATDDVWVVGGLGTVLHFDGAAWSLVDAGTTEQLFTVTGTDDEVVVVGGSTAGVVLRGGLDGFVDDTPVGAPLLQGVTVGPDGDVYVAGLAGYGASKGRLGDGPDWVALDLGFETAPQSVHALWHDGEALWGAAGRVLTPELDQGGLCTTDTTAPAWAPEPVTPQAAMCPADRIDPVPGGSIARKWSELLLDSVRRDFPHPPVHARNIYHLSLAMFDTWAAYDGTATPMVQAETVVGAQDGDLEIAISHAAYTVLSHRYANAIGADVSLDCYRSFMDAEGLDADDVHTEGSDPVAIGNRIGMAVLDHFADDGANEANAYADTTDWEPTNPVMIVDRPGTNVVDPDVWQQLNLGTAETQNGLVLDDSVQPYIGPQWSEVEPFALVRDPNTGLYTDFDDGYPTVEDDAMVDMVVEVIRKTAELDIADGELMEIGPKGNGNNTLGKNDGEGYATNPETGKAYAANRVLRGDFARVVAEMWADGPTSETPPGHWMVLANEVSDLLAPADLVPFAEGDPVDRLAWDVGLYLGVGGAVHDGAIAAWELKRDSLGPRPITLVRWMAQNGQRTDPDLPNYDFDGLPLVPGLIEVITDESSAPGERHHHLKWHVGEVAIFSWPGEPGDRLNDHTPLQWMRAADWIPYQRRTFVTPAFPGFVSGHSTFSRAAAEVLTAYTGDPYFPGGLHEFVAEKEAYLKFESGPSETIHLQWATYYDAADQAGQSRLWGGIHIFADDTVGRVAGEQAGLLAAAMAKAHVQGTVE